MCLVLLSLFYPSIITALPFVTTWQTANANDYIELPQINTQTDVVIDWGDSSTDMVSANTFTSYSHTYLNPGLYNVSIEGQIFWTSSTSVTSSATTVKMMDIVSWGDGFLINPSSTHLFHQYTNLRVSAPPNTQPVFLPGSTLRAMFALTSFNSSLDWDLANVTDLLSMFELTPLNQPITLRNTQGVTTISGMFFDASQFNQPFHFDASGLLDASYLFAGCTNFNQVVNLKNSSKMTNTRGMFSSATSFNQPITFNTDSVNSMDNMFLQASNFNQPVNFNVSQVTTMAGMFALAFKFNQPINFQASANLINCYAMFLLATSFNQPVTMNTSSVTNMYYMFYGSNFASTVNFTSTAMVTDMSAMFALADWFTQDLSSWDTTSVTQCNDFCKWCGLPEFPNCVPCDPKYRNGPLSVCTDGTRTPTTAAPAITLTPTRAPTSRAPTRVCQGFRRCYDCALAGCKWVQTQTTVGCVAPSACTENAACIAKQAKCPESLDSPNSCTGYCGQVGRSGCSCSAGCAGNSCCRDFNYSCPPILTVN